MISLISIEIFDKYQNRWFHKIIYKCSTHSITLPSLLIN